VFPYLSRGHGGLVLNVVLRLALFLGRDIVPSVDTICTKTSSIVVVHSGKVITSIVRCAEKSLVIPMNKIKVVNTETGIEHKGIEIDCFVCEQHAIIIFNKSVDCIELYPCSCRPLRFSKVWLERVLEELGE